MKKFEMEFLYLRTQNFSGKTRHGHVEFKRGCRGQGD